jgi:succinoglycan biosynthesis transport protein ExoP
MEIFDRPLPNDSGYRVSSDDSIDLRKIFAKFWARKRLIFASIFICAGLAYVNAKLITPTYTGEALVMIKPQQAREPATNASVQAAIQGGPEAVPSEAIVLQSRALASKTIERLHLDRDPEFDPSLTKPNRSPLYQPVLVLLDKVQGLREDLERVLFGAAEAPVPDDEAGTTVEASQSAGAARPSTEIVNALIGNLHLTVLPHSNVIAVSFKSSHARTAAAVPNTLVQLYLEQLANEKDQALAQERERLDQLVLPTLREKMHNSELALANHRQRTGLVGDQNTTILAQELNDIRAQLSAARARKAEATARLSQIEAVVSSPGQPSTTKTASPAAASESPILQHLRQQEVELEAQLYALKDSSHGPNYPKAQQLAAQLDEVRGAMRRESAGLIGRLRAEAAAAQATEAALNQREAEFMHQFALVNGGDTQLQSLVRDADVDRQTYERYLARLNEIYASMGHAQPDATLVSLAAVPLVPSFPKTRLMVMLGAAIGGGMGVTLAGMINLLMGGIQSESQVEDVLGVKCLGSLPRLKRPRRNGHQGLLRNTAFGHAIRSIQLQLLSFDAYDDPHRVILVTAALPGEGKTSVAASLAASLAADGVKVALVECDLDRPTVHRIFGALGEPGLTDYFAGSAALDQIVHTHTSSGIDYIPVGAAQLKEAWRITASRMRPLIDELTRQYAFIILDSAPVLAVSETILLSQIAQKTIFVVKWRSTPRAVARHALMRLLQSRGAETGVLLSMVDAKRAASYGDPVASVDKQLATYYLESPRASTDSSARSRL